MLKNLLQQKQQQQQKPPRNICFGSAKTSGEGATATDILAADVSLVASGVGKGCTPDKLKDFLASKGINAVEVVMLTKEEVIEQVRTLTFRIAVKAADYEAALKPEVWPYRVGVRHYRAPRREKPESSWQGQVEKTDMLNIVVVEIAVVGAMVVLDLSSFYLLGMLSSIY